MPWYGDAFRHVAQNLPAYIDAYEFARNVYGDLPNMNTGLIRATGGGSLNAMGMSKRYVRGRGYQRRSLRRQGYQSNRRYGGRRQYRTRWKRPYKRYGNYRRRYYRRRYY